MGIAGSKAPLMTYTEAHADIKQHFLERLMTRLTQNYNAALLEGSDSFRFSLSDVCYMEEDGVQLTDIPLRIFQNAISQSIPAQYNLTITKNRDRTTMYEVRFLYGFAGKVTEPVAAAPAIRLAHAALAVAIANDDTCPITLELLTTEKTNSVASCGHIVSGVFTDTKCPLCRRNVGWTVVTPSTP